MTAKQQKFCDEYLIDLNATRAYKAAYPHIKSDGAARANASRLLTKANIKAYIDECLAEMSSARIAQAKEVMEYLTSVMRGEHKEQTLQLIGDGVQRISNIDVSAKDRLKAAELLGKRYSLFTDKVNVEGTQKVVIIDDLEDV